MGYNHSTKIITAKQPHETTTPDSNRRTSKQPRISQGVKTNTLYVRLYVSFGRRPWPNVQTVRLFKFAVFVKNCGSKCNETVY